MVRRVSSKKHRWSGDGQEGFVKKRAHLKSVTEALTAIAFAIAVAPASPILLAPNLQNTSRSGDGQESFVKKRQVGQGMVRRVSSESERTPTFSTRR